MFIIAHMHAGKCARVLVVITCIAAAPRAYSIIDFKVPGHMCEIIIKLKGFM